MLKEFKVPILSLAAAIAVVCVAIMSTPQGGFAAAWSKVSQPANDFRAIQLESVYTLTAAEELNLDLKNAPAPTSGPPTSTMHWHVDSVASLPAMTASLRTIRVDLGSGSGHRSYFHRA